MIGPGLETHQYLVAVTWKRWGSAAILAGKVSRYHIRGESLPSMNKAAPLWLLNPGEMSSELPNRGITTKRTYVLQNLKQKVCTESFIGIYPKWTLS